MVSPSNSKVLWTKIHLAQDRLFAATHRFWNHAELSRLLPAFLVQAHGLMSGGLTMMSIARERALALGGDPVSGQVAAYLGVHLEEERGHDAWLLEDILTLGLSREEVLETPPCAAVVQLLGAQYFWMARVHPVAIFGYLVLLEGYAPVSAQLEEIRRRTGFPESAFRCLHLHAENDPAHLADLNRTLDAMDLSVDQARAVGLCAFAAIEGVAAMFEELTGRLVSGTLAFAPVADARKEAWHASA